MDYQRAKDVRGKSFSSLLLDNIVGGGGVGASLNKTISEKTQASVKGIKQAFDPLQIAKTLTFGGNIAPALLGRAMGRSKGDIKFFTGRTRKRRSAFALDNSASGVGQINFAVELLGGIYELLVEQDQLRKQEILDREKKFKKEEDYAEFSNQELIKALTARRKKEKKVYRDEKGRFAKEPVVETPTPPATPPTPPTPPKTPPTPTAKPPTTPTVTQPPAPATPTPTVKPTPTKTTPIIPPSVSKGIAVGAVTVGFGAMAAKTLVAEEGFSAKAYWDPPGHKDKLVSIGYGHQIKQNEYTQGYIQAGNDRIPIVGDKGIDTKITKEQALKLKEKDLEIYTNDTVKSIGQDAWDKLSDQQKVALVSSTYNTGKGGMDYLVKNGLRDAILQENYKGAADIIRTYGFKTEKGQKSAVLEKRRNREAAMFEEGTVNKLKPQTQNNLGDKIDTAAKENRELKESLNRDKRAQDTVTNNITTNTNQKSEEREETVDDKPALMKKRRM